MFDSIDARRAQRPSEDNPRVRFPPPLLFAGLLGFGLYHDASAIELGPLQVIGSLIIAGGLGLILAALRLFSLGGTRPEPWQPADTLVLRGPYRFTRNPMYLGMSALSLGVALLFSSFSGGALTFVAAIVIDRAVIPKEEAYLVRRFGQAYSNYIGRVSRWL